MAQNPAFHTRAGKIASNSGRALRLRRLALFHTRASSGGQGSLMTALVLGSADLPPSRITRLKITLAAKLVGANGLSEVMTK